MGGGVWLQRGRLRTVAGTGRHDHLALHDESFKLLHDSVLIVKHPTAAERGGELQQGIAAPGWR